MQVPNLVSETYKARLVAVQQDGIKANQCLTMLASSSTTQYFYLHLADCGSNISPPASQSFRLWVNDFGNEILFVSMIATRSIFRFGLGLCSSTYRLITQVGRGHDEGVALASSGSTPVPETTSSTHQVKLWGEAVGESYGTFVIHGWTGNE